MPWLNHPAFRALLRDLRPRLHSKSFTFRRLSTIAFLCGGARSLRREYVAKHLQANHPQILLFYADEVWSELASRSTMNALQMEELLGQLSDIVIVIVESPGTFAEIGAFSLSPQLRRKLLPIVDIQFRGSNSFICTGPLKWIDTDSDFRPTIWVELDAVLRSADELSQRLSLIPKPKAARIENVQNSPKHLLFLLCDYIGIFGPCAASQMVQLLDGMVELDVEYARTLLGLARAMGLVEACASPDGHEVYYLPSLKSGHLRVHLRTKFLDIPRMRLEVLSVLQEIPEAQELLSRRVG